MNKLTPTTKLCIKPLCLSLFVSLLSASAMADELRDLPYGVGNDVKPNILLLFDDSFSMQWEAILPDDDSDSAGVNDNTGFGFVHQRVTSRQDLLRSCIDYNRLHYNPEVDYKPWYGKDFYGNGYVDYRTISAADAPTTFNSLPNYPYNHGDFTLEPPIPYDSNTFAKQFTISLLRLVSEQGGNRNITFNGSGQIYGSGDTNLYSTESVTAGGTTFTAGFGFVESAGNQDGVFEFEECHYLGNTNAIRRKSMLENFQLFADMPTTQQKDADGNTIDPHSMGNFANWFVYYRSRAYSAKSAISQVLSETNARVGFATIHDVNHGAGIRDITEDDNREKLLKSVHQAYNFEFGTPTRRALFEAGRYFLESEWPDARLFGVRDFENDLSSDNTVDENNDGVGDGNRPIVYEDGRANRATVANGVFDGAGSTLASSPIFDSDNNGSCQRNSTILFTDGAMWGDTMDFDIGSGDNNYPSPYGSSINQTMADVAAYWADTDLSTTLGDEVGVTDDILGGVLNHQHMATYVVGFGLNPTVDDILDTTNPATWPNPNITTINGSESERELDAVHAAIVGRGAYFSASTPEELTEALSDTFTLAEKVSGTASAVSFNSGSIGTDTRLFQATFSVDDLTGDIQAFAFTDSGVGDLVWSAEDSLPAYSNRNIVTYNGSQGVEFTWGNLSSRMTSDLDANTDGEDVLNYIKGDRTNEAGSGSGVGYRNRDAGILGPFIHSSPQFSGSPSEIYPDLIGSASKPYSSFVSSYYNRTPLVFAGSNDGMLHAFNAETGVEVFAYIPNILENSLNYLAQSGSSTLPYVDATPTIRDVFVNGDWSTYLVGGLRKGGKGIYVLDVTDPSNLGASSVKFEIANTDTGFEQLGYTYSRPQIAKLNNGKWAAIFGNGYHNENDGQAYLYVVDLENGSLIKKYSAGSSGVLVGNDCTDDDSFCNGLSSPALADVNSDSVVDYVYAGDLHGNLWVFDLSLAELSTGENSGADVIFTACVPGTTSADCSDNDLSDRQSITTVPELEFHRTRNSISQKPNIMVYFGTGQFLTNADSSTTAEQSFYAIWDSSERDLKRADLKGREFEFSQASGFSIAGDAINYNDDNGWYIDLNPTGAESDFEGSRIVTSPLVIGDIIFFLINIPGSDGCNASGSSFIAGLDLFDGTQSDVDPFSNGAPLISASDQNFQGDAVGIGSIDRDIIINSDEGETRLINVNSKAFIPAGRRSWSILR